RRFVEKPSAERAAEYARSPDYRWNAGIFLFKAEALIEEMTRHAPEVIAAAHAALDAAVADLDFLRVGIDAFKTSPSLPLDTAVMEKTDRGAVVTVDMGWSDIG